MSEYTQGICADGAAILKDGVMMTIEEILEGLRCTQQPVVPEGYRVERGSGTYNEILVTAPDGGQQTFWPDDAAYVLIKALLPAGKENNNAIK